MTIEKLYMLSVASTHSTELPDTDGINLTDAQKSIAKTNDLIRVLKIQSIFSKKKENYKQIFKG